MTFVDFTYDIIDGYYPQGIAEFCTNICVMGRYEWLSSCIEFSRGYFEIADAGWVKVIWHSSLKEWRESVTVLTALAGRRWGRPMRGSVSCSPTPRVSTLKEQFLVIHLLYLKIIPLIFVLYLLIQIFHSCKEQWKSEFI